MIMLDYYTLQKTFTALSTDEHTYTATDIATLCRAGKLTPLFSYNRYAAEETPVLNTSTGEDYMGFEPYTITPFSGYLTNRKLLDLLDGYDDSIVLNYAYDDKGYKVKLFANAVLLNRLMNDENYSPYSDDDALIVTRERLLFKSEEVELLAEQPLTSQRNRAQTDDTNTDKKLIAMLAILLAKQSNTFRIGDRPNATQINEQVYNLTMQIVKELDMNEADTLGLKANTDKISKAVQAHADMFKLSKD